MPSKPLVRAFAAVCGVVVLAGCASTISAGEGTVDNNGAGESGRVAAAPLTDPTLPVTLAPAVPVAPAVASTPVSVTRTSASNSLAGFGPITSYPRPTVFSLPPVKRGKIVYLTFDDGPTPYTTEVLTLLKQYNAKATFFVIGNQVGKRIPTVKRAYRDGHAVENHTWSHPALTRLTWSQFRSQIARTNVAVAQATGDSPECLRAPYGSINRNVLLRAQRFNMPVIQWSIDSRDWAKPGTYRIVRNVLNNVKDGSIVLMHDGGGNRAQTVAALKYILPSLRKQGYAIRALPCGVNG